MGKSKSIVVDKQGCYPSTLDELVMGVKNTIHEFLQISLYDKGYRGANQTIQKERRKELRKSLKDCSIGDLKSKEFVKEYISDILQSKYHVTEESLEQFISFMQVEKLTGEDKFAILLYVYKIEYGSRALEEMIEENSLADVKFDEDGEVYYEVTDEDIASIFAQSYLVLDFYDKLQILVQRVYSLYIGNGVLDELCEMRIDGLSAGVSGVISNIGLEKDSELLSLPASYESIWLFYHGKSIYFSFLKFPNERELIRICKNIYRYNNPGYLSQVRGYIVNELYDGSRVAVARPPFCEGWVLFIRKFNSQIHKDIHCLLTDNNCILPIQMMKWLIKGCQIIAITGEQGAGKTTMLMSLIRYISPEYNLRVQELSFELHLRKIYPTRNIVSFKETDSVSGMTALEFMKKTDGSVNILGEVASTKVATWLIMMSQVASLFTVFTHHAKTTKDLVYWMRNALLLEGGFQNESAALRQVIDVIRIDVHMAKHKDGHRFIERISCISPKRNIIQTVIGAESGYYGEEFEVQELLALREGKYCMVNPISKELKNQIEFHLSEVEKEEFKRNVQEWESLYG